MHFDDSKIEEILFREEINIARFTKRLWAFLIDDFLISLIFIVALVPFVKDSTDTLASMNFIQTHWLTLICFRLIYQSVFTYFYGASIGKMLLKIKIIQVDDLDTPSLINTFLRCCTKEIGQILMYITYFFALNDRFVRTIHDRIARTIVIDEA